MSDTEILRSLLVDDLFDTISEENGRRFARLKESGISAKLKQVDLYDVPDGSLLLKLDKCDQPKTIFKGKHGERQRCDYVLVTSMDNNPMLVFIEMKSATLKTAEIVQQFKGAECILDYCDAILTRFHGQSNFLQQFRKRFVVFYRPRLPKKRTRPATPSQNNDSPERALKYPSPHKPSLRALVAP